MSPTSQNEPGPPGDNKATTPYGGAGSGASSADHAKRRAEHAKGFVLNVSAAHAKGVGDGATGRTVRIDAPLSAAIEVDEPAETEAEELVEIPAATLDALPIVRSSSARQKRQRIAAARESVTAADARRDPGGAVQPRRRRLSAWSLSCVVHGVMFVALSLVTIAQIQPRDEMDLVMAPDALEELNLADHTLDADAAADAQVGELVSETSAQTIDPGTPTLGMEAGAGLVGELTDEFALVGGGGGGAETGPPGGLGGSGGLFGNGTGGLSDYGTGLGGQATAQFFGTKIEGRRVVFVLDNSGSMQQGRLETVIAELTRCVESLTDEQEFYVVFYSDIAYPLFYPNPADNYIRPTERNKQRLAAWLDTVELCLGDAVGDALAGAISIEPDTVFLLSDGRIQGEKKMSFLLQAGGGDFPIHTVGVGLSAGAAVSRKNLQDIAAANNGDFREAEVPAEMRQLARDKPRPYHNKGPGPIWGRSVKPWGGR